MYGCKGRFLHVFGGGILKERDHSKVLGLDGRIILKLILCKYDGRVRI
jgi:hypothetical protein